MQITGERLTVPGMRVMLFVAFLLVLSVGVSLFVLSAETETYFAWTIQSQITAACFGAFYWAAGVLELLASRERLWINTRIAVPAVFVFSVLTLLITLMHLDRFHFNAPVWITVTGTWFWLAVYVIVPIAMAILWFIQMRVRGVDPRRIRPLPVWMRVVLIALGAAALLPGIGLLIAPQAISTLWPWSLTPLTSRAMGAWLIGWGIVTWQMVWENDLRRVRPAFVSLFSLGILQAIVLIRYPNEVQWQGANAWLYALFMASMLVIGAYGWFATRQGNLQVATEGV